MKMLRTWTKSFEQFHEILKHLFLGIIENDPSISYLDETKILHVDIIENIKYEYM